MIDRVGFAVSALGVLVSAVLVTAALQAHLTGDESGWSVAFACLVQVFTVWQLVRDISRRRSTRSEAG
ncbi:hypothetical protein [Streptomyces sp. LN499]|uniref:hypothetical protein n=1 Tax=Streptomyces sp. LN499 TaxID=3112977 RepID=UPI003718A3EB